MGINVNGLRFLLYAKRSGVDFSRTATIGRQGLHMTFGQFVRTVSKEFSWPLDTSLGELYSLGYADGLLAELGASVVDSFDYSDYEGATHLHDFNFPIPSSHVEQYTAVLDGGSLEHVFNFPVAIRNAMQLVARGGDYLACTPINNYCGHGFYQFSPELYYRVFSPPNGFRVECMFLHEGRESPRWYIVPDPDVLRHRVELRNGLPTLLLLRARRAEVTEIFETPPLQSDYVTTWAREPLSPRFDVLSRLKHMLPTAAKRALKSALYRSYVMPSIFRRVDPRKAHLLAREPSESA